MVYCLNKVVLYLLLICSVAASGVYASPDSLSLPPALVKKLAAFRTQDNLDYWIYERMNYVEKDPVNRIDFLMRSQQEAWRTYKTYYERMAWFDLLSVQGYYQLQTGNILGSINAYEAALAFYESYPLPDADIIETVLKPLGNNYTRLADYNTALFIHSKTMALALKANNNILIASTYSNMAICAFSQDDPTGATMYCKEGLRYAPASSPLYGLLLSTMAGILTAQQQYDSAEAICNTALKKLQKHQHDAAALNWYAGALQAAAKIALHKQQFARAAAYANQSARLLQQHFPLTKQREKAKLQVLLGDIHLTTNNNNGALACYQQALLLLLPGWKPANLQTTPSNTLLYSENTLADALSGKAAAFTQLKQSQQALQHFISSFVATGKLRKELFYTESKIKEISQSRSHIEAATKLAYDEWVFTNDKKYLEQLLLITEMSRAQVLMDERRSRQEATGLYAAGDSLARQVKQLQQAIVYYQRELLQVKDKKPLSQLLQQAEYDLSLLNKKIKRVSLTAQSDTNTLTVQSLNNMMQQLPHYVTVLEFLAGTNSSFIIEITNKGIQGAQEINDTAAHHSIPAFMQRWFANGPAAMMNEPQAFYAAGNRLYESVFKSRSWHKDRSYLLIPDGVFCYLPFEALITHPAYKNDFRQWPLLFNKAMLTQAYSLSTWYQQQTTNYNTRSFTGFFVSKGQHAQQVALSIEEEYRMMGSKVRGQYYTNTTATWNAFNNSAGTTGVLHISSLAVSSAGDSFPYLQLYDKPFYLFDLRYSHFSPALVVLSACKTADGSPLAGEGLNSIGRAFTAAGAGGVVSSLWNANDKTAIAIMQRFYEQLSQQPDAGVALHNAKKQWLQENNENAMMQLPYYWAGFIYSGHLQKVTLPAVSTNRWYYWLPALLLIPALWLMVKWRKKKRPR